MDNPLWWTLLKKLLTGDSAFFFGFMLITDLGLRVKAGIIGLVSVRIMWPLG